MSLPSAEGSDVGGATFIAGFPVAFLSFFRRHCFQWNRHQLRQFKLKFFERC